jgi:hypothetical protein
MARGRSCLDAALNDGLRHGSQGSTGTKQLLALATGLIEQYAPEQRMLAPRIRERLMRELDAIPTRMLAEYFAKPGVSQELFTIAKALEGAVFKTTFVPPRALSPAVKGMLGVLLDFREMDRSILLRGADSAEAIASVELRQDHATDRQTPLPGLDVNESG